MNLTTEAVKTSKTPISTKIQPEEMSSGKKTRVLGLKCGVTSWSNSNKQQQCGVPKQGGGNGQNLIENLKHVHNIYEQLSKKSCQNFQKTISGKRQTAAELSRSRKIWLLGLRCGVPKQRGGNGEKLIKRLRHVFSMNSFLKWCFPSTVQIVPVKLQMCLKLVIQQYLKLCIFDDLIFTKHVNNYT